MAPKGRAGRPAGRGDLLARLVPRWLSSRDVAQVIQAMSFGHSSPRGACVGAEERGQVFYRDRAVK